MYLLKNLIVLLVIILYCGTVSAEQPNVKNATDTGNQNKDGSKDQNNQDQKNQEQNNEDRNIADYEKAINKLVDTEIKVWVNNDVVINAILEQNKQNANLTEADCRNLNRKWKSEQRKSKKNLIKKVLSSELSDYLRYIQARSENLYTEIIVTDSKGLNVGDSIISGNYWHGDESVWENTFGNNSYAAYISDLEFDNDTQLFQAEVSLMIVHNEEPIGIVIVGIDVEQLDDL